MLVAPIPRPGESPKSLLNRFAMENLFPSVPVSLDIPYADGNSTTKYLFGDVPQVRKFASRLRDSQNLDLEDWFYKHSSGFTQDSPVVWKNCRVPMAFLAPKASRICPCCIKKNFIHQSADFLLFETCVTHQKRLIDTCPTCFEPLSWINGSIGSCRWCKANLSELLGIDDDRPSEKILLKWVELGESERFEHAANLMNSLRHFYPKEFIRKGYLLDAIIKIIMDEIESGLQVLASCYPVSWIPRRFVISPFFMAPGVDLNWANVKFVDHLKGVIKVDNINAVTKDGLRVSEVEFGLNITSVTRRKLESEGFLQPSESTSGYSQLSSSSVFKLVQLVEGFSSKRKKDSKSKFQNFGAYLLRNLKSLGESNVEVSVHDWSEGLQGFKIRFESNPVELLDPNFLDVVGFAEKAKTYPDAIRRAVHAGAISSDRPGNGRNPMLFSLRNVEEFCQKYCFLSEIGQLVGQGRTIISSILEANGIHPISGPLVDGALVPVYRRVDLQALDIVKLVKERKFQSNAGRKKNGVVLYDKDLWLPSAETASILGFSAQEISQAVCQGFLVTGVPDGRNADNRRYFTRLSVLAFRETLATSILIDDAREMLSISKREFQLRFLDSNFVQPIKISRRQWIRSSDLLLMKKDCQQYISLRTAGLLLGAPERHFRNLLSTRRIDSISSNQTISAQHIDLIARDQLLIHGVVASERSLWSTAEQ